MSVRTDKILEALADGEWHDFEVNGLDGYHSANFQYLTKVGFINCRITGRTASAIATDAGLAECEKILTRQSANDAKQQEATDIPPGPYTLSESATAANNGRGYLSVVDANGRKIASLWGKAGEGQLLGQLIIDAEERHRKSATSQDAQFKVADCPKVCL